MRELQAEMRCALAFCGGGAVGPEHLFTSRPVVPASDPEILQRAVRRFERHRFGHRRLVDEQLLSLAQHSYCWAYPASAGQAEFNAFSSATTVVSGLERDHCWTGW